MACPPITAYIQRASFGILSRDDIRQISVKKLTEPKSFEKAGAVHEEGLYSHALGPIKRFETCTTCGLSDLSCPGHYGHIELSVPVFNPMLVQTLFQILNKMCIECYHLRLSPTGTTLFLTQLEALNHGFDHLVDDLDDVARDICRDEKAQNDEYMNILLRNKLNQMMKEEKEKTPGIKHSERPQQRSIVERLSKLFRNFINGQLIKPLKKCPHCQEKKTAISLHQQSVIVVGSGSSKPLVEIDEQEKRETLASSRKKRSKKGHLKARHLEILQSNEKKFITPVGARKMMRHLWQNEKDTMERLFHFLDLNDRMKNESQLVDGNNKAKEDEEVSDIKSKLKFEDRPQPTDLFFVGTLIVPPSKFRPPMTQRGYTFEGPGTASISAVMKLSVVVQDFINQLSNETDSAKADRIEAKLLAHWKDLQVAVNSLYDNEMDKYGKNKYPGLKQLIDKKEGLFRKNMMGKRVNFAARSVISPDPNISVDQIGVPLVFAKKLTYPQPVTPWNIKHLREAVLNGPDNYPGATSIVFDDGVTMSLTKESVRQSIAPRLSYNPRYNPKFRKSKQDSPMVTIVNRHLLNDDVLLFNRQPTLHKCSIMAFRARVLPNEKGFRLHYANCKSFNADFDGDEMNAHLPQSELARSEAYNIASVNHQYLVPKDGSPLGGLIQDHVVAVCILTQRGQLLDKERYHQLVYCALAFLERGLDLEPPAIIKPEPIWTGKQVITTIIRNCIPRGKLPPTLRIKSKIGTKILNISPEYEQLSDCHVYIKDGELLTGFMDKSNVGATQYGLIHTCYELYGGETSSNLMSAFARLSTWYLQLYEGFTLGIADILVEDDANDDRQTLIKESRVVGPDSAKEALSIVEEVSEETLENKLREAHSDRDPLPMKKLDAAMKKRTDNISSNISSRCLPASLIRKFPDNNLQMMIQTGAKGGTVNALQISCLLGQIELEGRRVPLSMSGRTLPSFKPYDTSPKAGGFVSGRFLTGIQPQEFFFHCMAGREGLIDTAVKTSRSGYLQRCLIKHLEGLSVHYDQTVRDSCGSVIQFLYGEDGLDIVKSQMLKEKAFSSLIENYKILSPSEDELKRLNKLKEAYEEDVIAATENIQEWLERNGENRVQKIRGSGFLDFQWALLNDPEKYKQFVADYISDAALAAPEKLNSSTGSHSSIKEEKNCEEEQVDEGQDVKPSLFVSSASQSQVIQERFREQSIKRDRIRQAWYALTFKEKRKWNKDWDTCPDPLISLMNPGSHFGVVPEKLDEKIEKFVEDNPNLVVNSASLIGRDGNCQQALIDANPELSKTIFAYWDQMPGFHIKPKLTKHEFYNLCYNLFMKMLAQPGEAVGLLAAQSIGEPSTQMTLNTFHFAGRGEMNVTLGIPRLREILMTASAKIGTPSMDLPLLPVMRDLLGNELSTEETEEQAQLVKLALNAVRLSDVLEFVDITEQLVEGSAIPRPAASGRKKSKSRKSENEKALEDLITKNSIRYTFDFNFLPRKYYEHEFKTKSKKIMQFMEEVFIKQLIQTMFKRQKRLEVAETIFDVSSRRMNKQDRSTKSADTSGGVASANDVEEQELDSYNAEQKAKEKARDDESSSDDDDDGEGDNTTARMKSRRNPELDYEEAEDDDLEVADTDAKAAELEENDKEILADEEEVTIVASFGHDDSAAPKRGADNSELNNSGDSITTSKIDFNDEINALIANNDDDDLDNKKQSKRKEKVDQVTALERIEKVKSLMLVTDYEFDRKHQRWCKVSIQFPQSTTRLDIGALVESEAKSTFIHRVGNIQRALLVKDVNAKARGAKCDSMIKTEGVSLLSLVKFNHIIDLNAIYSNDIHAIANTYGIEAASQAIRREMANVFAVYGIEVDPRHLSLIADYMTYNGGIRGMNRMSMEASASPFQQMSFESTLRYLKWAAILGLRDDIKSPSAALVFGRPTRGGTGIMSTLMEEPSEREEAEQRNNFGVDSRPRRRAHENIDEDACWNPQSPDSKRPRGSPIGACKVEDDEPAPAKVEKEEEWW